MATVTEEMRQVRARIDRFHLPAVKTLRLGQSVQINERGPLDYIGIDGQVSWLAQRSRAVRVRFEDGSEEMFNADQLDPY